LYVHTFPDVRRLFAPQMLSRCINMTRYMIVVHLPMSTLTFSVNSYDIVGERILFEDRKTGKVRNFAYLMCEVMEEKQ